MKTAYDNYATDVCVIIPRGKAFADAVAGVIATGRIAADHTVTIDLAKMFAPGYPKELNPVALTQLIGDLTTMQQLLHIFILGRMHND